MCTRGGYILRLCMSSFMSRTVVLYLGKWGVTFSFIEVEIFFLYVQDLEVIDCVDHSLAYQRWTLEDPRVRDYVRRVRFFVHSQLRRVRLDHPILIALIERWRQRHLLFIFK